MRAIKYIIIHCADTYSSMDIGAKEINEWHKSRGWKGIGYHYVIRRDGTIETGRPESEVGAHVAGYNSKSIGICWVGGRGDDDKPIDNRTDWQVQMLTNLIFKLKKKYPYAKIAGHYEFDDRKACPCFDVKKEFGYLNNYENENEIETLMGLAERQENEHRDGGDVNSTSHSGFHTEPDAGGTDGVFADPGSIDWRFRTDAQGGEKSHLAKIPTQPLPNKTEKEIKIKRLFTVKINIRELLTFLKRRLQWKQEKDFSYRSRRKKLKN